MPSFPPESTWTHDDISDTVKTLSIAGSAYYYWRVQAYDYMNHRGEWSDWKSFSVRPSAPETVSASDGTIAAGVDLWWSGVGSADYYNIYRSDGTEPETLLAQVGGDEREYRDENAVPGKDYLYSVRAVDEGILGLPGWDSGWRKIGTTSLTVKDSDSEGITVQWEPVDYASEYVLYRKPSPERSWQLLNTLAATETEYTDRTVVPGKDYWYCVSIEVGHHSGDMGSFDSGWRTILPPMNVVASDTLTDRVAVVWDHAFGAVEYIVQRMRDVSFPIPILRPGDGLRWGEKKPIRLEKLCPAVLTRAWFAARPTTRPRELFVWPCPGGLFWRLADLAGDHFFDRQARVAKLGAQREPTQAQ